MKKLPIVLISMCLAVTIFMAVPAHAAGITYLKSNLYWNLNDSTIQMVNNASDQGVDIYNTVSFSNKTSISFDDIVFDSSLMTDSFTTRNDWYSQVITFSDYNSDSLSSYFTQFAIHFYRPIVLTAGQTLEFYFYITDCVRTYVNGDSTSRSPVNRYSSSGVRHLSYAGPSYFYDADGNNFYGDSNVSYYDTTVVSSVQFYNICYRAKYTASEQTTISYFRIPFSTTQSIGSNTWVNFSFTLVGSPLVIYDSNYNPGFEEPTTPAESEIISGIDAVESQQNQMNQTLDDINDKLEETYFVPEPEILPGYDVDDLIGESEAVESASDLMEAVESSMNTEDMLSGSRFWQSLIAEIISVPGFAVMGMMSGGFLITKAFIGR